MSCKLTTLHGTPSRLKSEYCDDFDAITIYGQRTMMRASVMVAVVGIILAAAGCDGRHRKEIAQCRMQAHKIYPGQETIDDSTWSFMLSCMESAGYEFRAGFGLCSERYMITDQSCWQTPSERWIEFVKRRLLG